jgi:hypothetical protein
MLSTSDGILIDSIRHSANAGSATVSIFWMIQIRLGSDFLDLGTINDMLMDSTGGSRLVGRDDHEAELMSDEEIRKSGDAVSSRMHQVLDNGDTSTVFRDLQRYMEYFQVGDGSNESDGSQTVTGYVMFFKGEELFGELGNEFYCFACTHGSVSYPVQQGLNQIVDLWISFHTENTLIGHQVCTVNLKSEMDDNLNSGSNWSVWTRSRVMWRCDRKCVVVEQCR